MSVNDTVQLAVKGIVGGQTHIHTLHFRYIDVLSTDSDLVADFQANALAEFRQCFSTADLPAQLITASQVCGGIPLRAPAEATPAAPAGTRDSSAIGDRLPSWLATITSERTALAGRSRRGRFYMGGMWEADTDGNNLTDGTNRAKNYVTLYAAKLMARYVTDGAGKSPRYTLAIHSRVLALPGVNCQDSSTLVNGLIVRTAVASMKSRKPGSGT